MSLKNLHIQNIKDDILKGSLSHISLHSLSLFSVSHSFFLFLFFSQSHFLSFFSFSLFLSLPISYFFSLSIRLHHDLCVLKIATNVKIKAFGNILRHQKLNEELCQFLWQCCIFFCPIFTHFLFFFLCIFPQCINYPKVHQRVSYSYTHSTVYTHF